MMTTMTNTMEKARVANKSDPEMHVMTIGSIVTAAVEYLEMPRTWRFDSHHQPSLSSPSAASKTTRRTRSRRRQPLRARGRLGGVGIKRARREDETSLVSFQQAIAAEELAHQAQQATTTARNLRPESQLIPRSAG